MKGIRVLFITKGCEVSVGGIPVKSIKNLEDFFEKNPDVGLAVVHVEEESNKSGDTQK